MEIEKIVLLTVLVTVCNYMSRASEAPVVVTFCTYLRPHPFFSFWSNLKDFWIVRLRVLSSSFKQI